jgi:group I intron endonuclease
MDGIIYIITNRKNGKVYIGQTTIPLHIRINQHFSRSTKCPRLSNAIKKYGRNNFKIEIIEKHNNKDDLDKAEINWIAFYRATEKEYGYNIAEGGHNGKPGLGKHMGEEQKKIIGRKNSVHMKRLWNDPVYRENQIKKHRGKSCRGRGFHISDETKQKLRKINLGKKYGEETGKKHREALKGRFVGSSRWGSRLTENNVQDIKRAITNGEPMKQIAKKYNVAYTTIAGIKYGTSWSWLTA